MNQKPDILTIIETESIRLSRSGKTFRGKCPIHDGKSSGSLAVYPEEQTWYCFGCNEGGDVIDFIMKLHNFDFKGACQYLNITPGKPVKIDSQRERQRKLQKAYHNWLKTYYHQLCKESVRLHHRKIIVQSDPCITENAAWKYAEDIGKLAGIEHQLDILWEGTAEEKFKLFKEIIK